MNVRRSSAFTAGQDKRLIVMTLDHRAFAAGWDKRLKPLCFHPDTTTKVFNVFNIQAIPLIH
jgi:hypothetical protein